MIRWRMMCRF